MISDTMDELGIPLGVVGASVLKPTMPGTIMVGPAMTLRNILQRIDPLQGARVMLMGTAEATDDPEARRRYLLRQPEAEMFVGFSDFAFAVKRERKIAELALLDMAAARTLQVR